MDIRVYVKDDRTAITNGDYDFAFQDLDGNVRHAYDAIALNLKIFNPDEVIPDFRNLEHGSVEELLGDIYKHGLISAWSDNENDEQSLPYAFICPGCGYLNYCNVM